MKAVLFVENGSIEASLKALEPDLESSSDLSVSASTERSGLKIEFDAKSLSLLRGAVNSYLRLLKSVEGL